jgi:hypothetical protein
MNDIDVALERLLKAWPPADMEGDKLFHEAAHRSPPWLAEQAEAIRALGRNVVRDILEIGARLREVRKALYHGEWEKWLDVEFGWSSRTARRYMTAAKAFADKSDMVSELPIDIGAIYLLARPRTPPEVRLKAIERARLGERITLAVAMQLTTFTTPSKGPPRHSGPPRDLRPLIARCVEENLDRVGFNEPFSWRQDTPTDIAAMMVGTNRSKAKRLMKALAKALLDEGSTCPSVMRVLSEAAP